MTTRSEREKAQKLNEQHQALLSRLLRDEDNKHCADCEAKGPRWASWNLGVFMCIRCAGIHRNLGVHISRVKSVNLDQWTPEQIQGMVDVGNGRARQLYEAHLPEGFRRPQTDQALEVFIRDKYDRKKYYDQEALATKEHEKKEKKKEKDTDAVESHGAKSECRPSPKKSPEPAVDLLNLDAPEGGGEGAASAAGPTISNPLPPSNSTQQPQPACSSAATHVETSSSTTLTSSTSTSTTTATTKVQEKKLLSKDSILSLYASSPAAGRPPGQQPPASGQGAYMGQPPMQRPLQGFAPAAGGGVPPSTLMGGGATMSGMANGGYMQPAGGPPSNPGASVQQGQCHVNQVTQQMSGVAVSGGGLPGAPPTGDWTAAPPPASGQTLSTQLWK